MMELLEEARELPSAERSGFLESACVGDAAMRREVERLLRHDSTSGDVKKALQPGGGAKILADAETEDDSARGSSDFETPESVGEFKILRRIGEGGMGIVFEAEQGYPRRKVALKLIRPRYLSEKALKRFEKEAHALGQLQHPGIAQIYETGLAKSDSEELPFIAMELIEGVPLTAHVREVGLQRRQILELVARVCEALHHAHERGIVHRDLKPGNILVAADPTGTGTDSTRTTSRKTLGRIGQPKILDFGIARIDDPGHESSTILTEEGMLVGTLHFMSPEQALGERDAIDRRSDIYSVGVILYEMLTGRFPYELTGLSLSRAAQVIAEVDPPRAGSVVPTLRGDLETILAKTLEKAPELRYATALELAGDLRRVLRDEPIHARPPSTFYQLKKFARRNKGLVAALTSIVLLSLVGVLVTSLSLVAKDRELGRAEEVKNVVVSMITSVWPEMEMREDTTLLRETLEETEARIDSDDVTDPLIEGELRALIGLAYQQIRETERGQTHLERAAALLREQLGPRNEAYLAVLVNSIRGVRDLGRFDEAEGLYEEALSVLRPTLGTEHPLTLLAEHGLAMTYACMGRFEDAEVLLRETLELHEKVRGRFHRDTLVMRADSIDLIESMGRTEEAESLSTELIEGFSRVGWGRHVAVLAARERLVNRAIRTDDLDQCLQEALPLLEITTETHGKNAPETRCLRRLIVRLLVQASRFQEAVELGREAATCEFVEKGHLHPTLVSNLARALRETERIEELTELLARHANGCREETGEDSRETRLAMDILATMFQQVGRDEDAADLRRRLAAKAGEEPALSASLARSLLKGERQEFHDPSLALSYAERACERSFREDPELLALLAAARAATGHPRLEFFGRSRAATVTR